ncbi:MAG: hypothetical protein IJI66_08750 [Erysipelotrichaceae bacterium]|nr:hypothetical protein [Erysipelotrichaceae bacterium]
MKAFFEEYGFVVVTLVVVFLIIGIASLIGKNGGDIHAALQNWIGRLTNAVDNFKPTA